MESWRFYELSDELKITRRLLLNIAAEAKNIDRYGFQFISTIEGAAESLDSAGNLEHLFYRIDETAKVLAPALANQLEKVLADGELFSSLSQLRAMVELSVATPQLRRFANVLVSTLQGYFGAYGLEHKSDGVLKLQGQNINLWRLISDIDRARPIVDALWETASGRESQDEADIFQPSRVNRNILDNYILNAAECVESAPNIREDIKIIVINHLNDARVELKEAKPAWQKIFGALAISATIIAGIAVAPEALANINTAYTYLKSSSLLQISVDPPALALPSPKDFSSKDDAILPNGK